MEPEAQIEAKFKQFEQERKDLLTPEAIEGKQNFDDLKGHLDTGGDLLLNRNLSHIEAFNENVKILVSIFYKSKFDEFIYLVANPQRIYTVNFFIGICRGMGFFVGMVFLLYLCYMLMDGSSVFQIIIKP